MLTDTEIHCLVEKGFLKAERRHDHAAIQSAINGFICNRSSERKNGSREDGKSIKKGPTRTWANRASKSTIVRGALK